MKLKKIVLITSALMGLTSAAFAADNADATTDVASNDKSVMDSISASSDIDRSGQFYAGLGVGGNISPYFGKDLTSNSNGYAYASALLGYNFNKNWAVQGYLTSSFDDTSAQILEGVYNFSNSTKFTPYLSAGMGMMNASDLAWDVGTGVKYDISKDFAASLDYKYLSSMGGIDSSNYYGSRNWQQVGVTGYYYFGGPSK